MPDDLDTYIAEGAAREPRVAALEQLRHLINRWRNDPGGTYRTWFLWEERIKNFHSIKRGIQDVVAKIEDGTFGTSYKDSSLEIAVGAIAEQRQVFKGADHAFLWKPRTFGGYHTASCGGTVRRWRDSVPVPKRSKRWRVRLHDLMKRVRPAPPHSVFDIEDYGRVGAGADTRSAI